MQESQKPYSRGSLLIAQDILGQSLNLPHSIVLSKTWVKGRIHCLKFLKEFHEAMNVEGPYMIKKGLQLCAIINTVIINCYYSVHRMRTRVQVHHLSVKCRSSSR